MKDEKNEDVKNKTKKIRKSDIKCTKLHYIN